MNRTLALATAVLALAACSPDFDPASKVDKLRVLAIQANPPEIEPASPTTVAPDRATLRSLVMRADFDPDAARTTTVVYLACVPVPGDPSPSACVMLAALRDPTVVLAQAAPAACAESGDRKIPPPIAFAGVEACQAGACAVASAGGMPLAPPEVALPPDYGMLFAELRARVPEDAPDPPELALGVQAVVLAFALDATADELLAAGAGTTTCQDGDLLVGLSRLWPRDHVLSTKRVQIRGPDAPDLPNENPAIDGIALDPATATGVVAGTIALTPVPPPDADYQAYTKLDAAGVPIETTMEEWVYSWFSTAGEIDELHTRGATADECRDEWKVSTPGPAVVAAVVRDLRGGVAWTVRKVEVTVAP